MISNNFSKKVKILTSTEHDKLEKKVNEFASEHHITEIQYGLCNNQKGWVEYSVLILYVEEIDNENQQ